MFYWFLFGTKRVRVVLSRLYYNSSKEYRTNIKTFIEIKKQKHRLSAYFIDLKHIFALFISYTLQ
jgi:hypothetical protein